MKLIVGAGLMLALLLPAAGPALAQKTILSSGNNAMVAPEYAAGPRFQNGLDFMQQKNFAEAAKAFQDVIDHDDRNANANYMMGVAQIGLNDLVRAGNYLRVAVKSNPKLVDAHVKLGYVEAKLGNADAAKEQRAALEKMDKACKGKCPDAAALSAGMTLIDKGLAEGPAPKAG
jgi:TolA-binding protein